jgi:short-subunit dehydrogenase
VARHAERLRALACALTDMSGRSVETLAADLTDAAALTKVETILRTDASVTLLVNNACVGEAAPPLLQADVQCIERMVALSVIAPTRLACAAAQGFAARGRGTIINVSSVAGIAPELDCGVHGASQAFVLTLSQSLRRELADRGIRVQAVLLARCSASRRKGGNGDPTQAVSPENLVDASLCGLQHEELVTIPALADNRFWENFERARKALVPHLTGDVPAARYKFGRRAN